MNDLKAYANSFEEGDTITITADFIDTLKSACEDLEAFEILKNHLWQDEKREISWVNSRGRSYNKVVKTIEVVVFENEEDYRKLKELLK